MNLVDCEVVEFFELEEILSGHAIDFVREVCPSTQNACSDDAGRKDGTPNADGRGISWNSWGADAVDACFREVVSHTKNVK